MSEALKTCIGLLVLASLAACSVPSGRVPIADQSLAKLSPGQTYHVRPGDTLYAIALAYDLDYRRLAAANNIGDDFVIYPGQRLRLTNRPVSVTASSSGSSSSEWTQDKSVSKQRAPVIVVRSANGDTQITRELSSSKSTPVAKSSTPTQTRASNRSQRPNTASTNVATKPVTKSAPSTVTKAKPTPTKPKSTTPVNKAPALVAVKWQWPSTGPVIKKFNLKGDINKGLNIAGNKGDPVFSAADGTVVFVGSGLQGYGNLVIIDHNARFLSAYAHNSRLLVKEKATVKAGQKIAEMGSSDAERVMLHFEIRRDGIPVNPLRYLPIR